jgi:amidase
MTPSDDLAYLSLVDLAERIRSRTLSPVEATEAMLARIAALDTSLHAYATVTAERARVRAREAESEIAAGRYRGPLHGVPIAVKDLCFTRGVPSAAGMAIHKDFVPPLDATVVARLELAGAILLGKLQMTEGAFSEHHPSVTPPVNPWHPDYWTGVSSSGSGVATAAGLCYGSLGSDTGGSIRFPSTSNGITGLKPTWGRVSRHGVFPLADSLDHIGPMTRSAADCAAMLAVIAGADPHDPTALIDPVPDYLANLGGGVRGLRIGIDRSLIETAVESEVSAVLLRALDVLAAEGALVLDIRLPDLAPMAGMWTRACAAETAMAHKATYPARADEYGPALKALIDLGRGLSALDYTEMQSERDRFKGRLRQVFAGIDLIALPAMPAAPMTIARRAELRRDPATASSVLLFTAPFDLSGSPTITLPAGFAASGVPIGFQLIGRHLDEAMLLRAGHAFQRSTDWHLRRPPV